MANISLLLNLIDELDREAKRSSYYGQDFGVGLPSCLIHRQPLQSEPANMLGYTLPLGLLNRLNEHQVARRGEKKENRVSPVGKDGFQVCMDVAQFKPSELNVKVVDNCVIIEGKHEEREDEHGFIERHFVRRYVLPKDYDADKVASTLSSDGVLTVSVPKPQIEDKPTERIVQIQQTGPAHLNVKRNSQEKLGDATTNGEPEEEKK